MDTVGKWGYSRDLAWHLCTSPSVSKNAGSSCLTCDSALDNFEPLLFRESTLFCKYDEATY